MIGPTEAGILELILLTFSVLHTLALAGLCSLAGLLVILMIVLGHRHRSRRRARHLAPGRR